MRDVNRNISLGLIKLFEDLEAFNSYPWGYESFKITIKYLLTPLMPKKVNLYGFHGKYLFYYDSFIFYWIMLLIYWRYFIGLGIWSDFLFETTSELLGKSFMSNNPEMVVSQNWKKIQNFLISSTTAGSSESNSN